MVRLRKVGGYVQRNPVAFLALFLALGGGAYATTHSPFVGSNGAINGCVPKKGGVLEVLKPGKKCPKSTVSVAFNQKGQPGKNGKNGVNGAPGSLILTRVRSTSATQTVTVTTASGGAPPCTANCPDSSHGAVVPLTGAAWTQPTGQIDEFFGSVTYTPPASSQCSYWSGFFTGSGLMSGEIDDAATGSTLASFSGYVAVTPNPQATTAPLFIPTSLEPAAVVHHALTVKIADNCGVGGHNAASGGHFTLNSLKLDPVGVS